MSDYTAALDAAIAALESTVEGLTSAVDPALTTRVTALEGIVAAIPDPDARLDALEARPDPSARLSVLESASTAATTRMDGLATSAALSTLGTQVTAQAATIAGNTSSITTQGTTVTAHTAALADLTARMLVLENRTAPPPPPPPNTDPTVAFVVTSDTSVAPLTFTATVTATNCDHWQFDWQGGTTQGAVHPATDTTVNHTYDQPGTYVATVRAWRDSDTKQATAEHTFVVQAPQVSTIGQTFGGYATPVGAYKTRAYNDNDAAKVAAAGLSWVRCDLTVAMVAPTATTRTWGNAYAWIDAFAAKDIKVMANLYILPQWMNNSTNDKTAPATDKVYADFCAEAAPLLYAHGVRAVELWNEQNWGFWAPTPDRVRYAGMAKMAALAIKAAEPRMMVISGGLSTGDTEYTNGTHKTVAAQVAGPVAVGANYTSPELGANQTVDIYGALGMWALKTPTGAQAFDGCGIHPYLDGYDPGVDATDPNWMNWQQTPMRRTISILDRWGGQGVKVWNTESACPRTKNDGSVNVTEQVQATRAANAFKAFNTWTLADGTKMRNRLGPYFYFTFADWDSASEVRARSFGLVNSSYVDHMARPAVSTVLATALA